MANDNGMGIKMNLFQLGEFTSNAGLTLPFKINCDALSDESIACVAAAIQPQLKPYYDVYGIPTGGERFAEALRKYINPKATGFLIADDVMTTGGSFKRAWAQFCKTGINIQGAVIFSRNPVQPAWIQPFMTMIY